MSTNVSSSSVTNKQREESKQRRQDEKQERQRELEEAERNREANKRRAEEVSKQASKKKQSSNLGYQIMFAVLGGLCLYVIATMFMNSAPPLHKLPVLDEKRMSDHNSQSPNWKMGPNEFFEGATMADAKRLMNVGFASHSNIPKCQVDENINIPESFDYRETFKKCVLPVVDMGRSCGASYALLTAKTVSERNCIANELESSKQLSGQELLFCDTLNGDCKNGHLNVSLDYVKSKGLVDEECLPFKPEEKGCKGMCENPVRTNINHFCLLVGEDEIKRDLLTRGPVLTTLQVHSDILGYKEGVYTKGEDMPRFAQQQAVRIIGWGVENGEEGELNNGNKYWLVEFAWGSTYGKDGVVKISSGQELFFDNYSYSIQIISKSRVSDTKFNNSLNDDKVPVNEELDIDLKEDEIESENTV